MRKQAKDENNDDDQDETKGDVSEQSKINNLRDVDIVNRLDQKQMTFVRFYYFTIIFRISAWTVISCLTDCLSGAVCILMSQ